MTTLATHGIPRPAALQAPATHMPAGRRARMYFMEARYELVKTMRIPAFVIPAIGFPIMFYILFGLVLPSGKGGSHTATTYLLATYAAFGVISIALFALGAGVATERGQGWLAVKRASPMPVSAYIMGKYAMTVLFALVLTILICTIGVVFGGVRLSPGHWAALVVVETLGGLPFCAIGLAIGYLAGPNSAAAVVNGVYLPMAFLSGLFIPVEMLPRFLQTIAPVFPPYHLARLAIAAVGLAPAPSAWMHVLALIGFGVLFTGIAVIAYRRDEGKAYG
ncbi:MAG: ABC transporter permease [Gemmatimonadaceae bacterium]